MQTKRRKTAYNTGLAKVAVHCSSDTFVVNQSLFLRINIYGENRHLRQALNRCLLFFQSPQSLPIKETLRLLHQLLAL